MSLASGPRLERATTSIPGSVNSRSCGMGEPERPVDGCGGECWPIRDHRTGEGAPDDREPVLVHHGFEWRIQSLVSIPLLIRRSSPRDTRDEMVWREMSPETTMA